MWFGVASGRAGGGAAPRGQVMTSPVYSMMRLARGDGPQREHALAVHAAAAHLDAAAAGLLAARTRGLGGRALARVGFIGYIEFMGARVCVRVRARGGGL